MLIDIDKIKIADRIRKDYGDLQELADDIGTNTLLNPPVVMSNGDGTFTLIAGERRLRAMRDILGYRQTEVNAVMPRDAEQALMMEISENECRKEFTKTERLDYARRLARIEVAKAKERQGTRTDVTSGKKLSEVGRSSDAVAQTLGTNRETIRQEQYIEDHRDILDPSDFAEWDEGKLSTNKAYQKVKAAQRRAEEERLRVENALRRVERERDEANEALEDAYHANELLENENVRLRNQPKPAPEIVEHEVIKEVVRKVAPDDYDELKRRVGDLKHEKDIYLDTNKELRSQLESTRKELEQAKDILGMDKSIQDVRRDVQYLISATNSYVRRYGGLTWTVDRLGELDDDMREQFRKAILNLATFSNALMESM